MGTRGTKEAAPGWRAGTEVLAGGLVLCVVERVGDTSRAVLAGWLGSVMVYCRCGCASTVSVGARVRGEAEGDSGDEPGKELKG